ncbi:hypothetical protein [Martelella alba]|uniref:Uncharacterized protein n=1 Tax=Martelella alba TaxID=2590451 RepID=A0ABY2SHN2_9HYPH|nr:hypothetical protein [Martelella alba]TKI03946.1 hypothetical protein FCN80_19685 [Martelella alba]
MNCQGWKGGAGLKNIIAIAVIFIFAIYDNIMIKMAIFLFYLIFISHKKNKTTMAGTMLSLLMVMLFLDKKS